MLRILFVHNFYQQPGGEDAVYRAERDLLRAYGHPVETLEFHNQQLGVGLWGKLKAGLLGFYNPGSARRLKEAIEAFQPDVIHVHNLFPVASPAVLWAARRAGVPVVMTLHNYRLICPGALLYADGQVYEKSVHRLFPWDAVRRGLYRGSRLQTAAVAAQTGLHKLLGTWQTGVARYIVLTEFARRRFLSSSLRPGLGQLCVKPNFVPDPGRSVLPREDFLLFVGRLTLEKGVLMLLQAARQGGWPLRILGDGPLRATVEAYAGAVDTISYQGFATPAVVQDALRRCRALVLPSEWYEGMPMVVLEAFAVGTPVLAARLGGPAEMVQQAVNGLLFTAGNAPDLDSQVRRLLALPALASALSDGARATYELYYTPSSNYQQLLAVYQAVACPYGESDHPTKDSYGAGRQPATDVALEHTALATE